MATVQGVIDSLPVIFQKRYGSAQVYAWLNDGLRELSLEGINAYMRREVGLETEDEDGVWITKPTDCVRPAELYHPRNANVIYPFEEIEGKIKLIGTTFDKDTDPDTASSFQNFTTSSMEINVTSLDEDDLKNFLLIISAGTYAGKTYVLSGNDESGEAWTKIYFMHTLAAALDGTKVTAAYYVDDYSYLMLKYDARYEFVDALDDEVPVNDDVEYALKAWLNWKAHERAQSMSSETKYWEDQWKKNINKINEYRLRVGRRQTILGRNLPGFRQNATNRYTYTHESAE